MYWYNHIMNVLFWNTKKNDVEDCLVDIIKTNFCDVVFLAENPTNLNAVCNTLSLNGEFDFQPIPNIGGCRKIHGIINTRYKISILQEHSRYQIVKISFSGIDIIIAAFHNISLREATIKEQIKNCRTLHNDITEKENMENIRYSIIVGDFNINPFDDVCIDADCLHAIPYKEQAIRHERIVQGTSYKMFYNPTWAILGRIAPPYGTYFYDNSGHVNNMFWHIYDQVLIRPSLIDAFDDSALTIIDTNNTIDKSGKPNTVISDHLPIFFKIREEML